MADPPEEAEKSLSNPKSTLLGGRELDIAPFTDDAFKMLLKVIDELIGDIVDEAGRSARRSRSEVISKGHLEGAVAYLVLSRSRRLARHIGTIGGILLGGSLSNILSMAQANAFPPLGTFSSLLVGLVGMSLVAFHVARD